MEISIKYSQSTTEFGLYAYALKVEVTSAVDMPTKIFVYQASTFGVSDIHDRFINIASPVDIEEIPEDAPDMSNDSPYYRTNTVVLWFRCLSDLEETKLDMDRDINTLVQTYKVLNAENDFHVVEEKTYV